MEINRRHKDIHKRFTKYMKDHKAGRIKMTSKDSVDLTMLQSNIHC